MKRLAGFAALLMAFTLQGCIATTVVLHVAPDGHGRAVITSRVFEPALHAFDSMFSESPKHAKTEEELPPPGVGEISQQFSAPVTLSSTKLEKVPDGVIRTTVVDFDDVTKLRMGFPPAFAVPSGGFFGLGGLGDQPVVTFAMKRHDNGDRLLLVRLPDNTIDPGPAPEITVFKTDSAEEQLFKRAIKGMSLKFFVELEDVPLLRTNAPAAKGARATILDLDLDRLINGLDEAKVRRAMTPGSMQEVLWQIGGVPGAVVPVDHEVFLEFEGPQQAAAPPATAAPAAQAPPDTEIYLAPLQVVDGVIQVGPAVDITNSAGYDNQPFFTADGRSVLFTSVRGPVGATQTDIYRYDILPRQVVQVTRTPESEYSATVTPDGNLSVIRVELDADKTQRLWQFTAGGANPRVVLESVKPVGYHAWADSQTLALFVLGPAGQPATLQLADTRTGTATILATDIGRSIQRIPAAASAPAPAAAISFVQRERTADGVNLVIKELNPATRAISMLTPAVAGSREADCAWMPNGTLLMANGGTLYSWRRGQSGWHEVVSLERLSLAGVTRLAVSPKGDYLALVGSPRQAR
jgi:hypothetical protein